MKAGISFQMAAWDSLMERPRERYTRADTLGCGAVSTLLTRHFVSCPQSRVWTATPQLRSSVPLRSRPLTARGKRNRCPSPEVSSCRPASPLSGMCRRLCAGLDAEVSPLSKLEIINSHRKWGPPQTPEPQWRELWAWEFLYPVLVKITKPLCLTESLLTTEGFSCPGDPCL